MAEFFIFVNHSYEESKQTKWIQTYKLQAKTKTLEPAQKQRLFPETEPKKVNVD